MTTKYCIDRFEEDIAILEREDQAFIEVPVSLLPEDVTEGDCLIFEDEVYIKDEAETDERRTRIEKKMRTLFVD